MISKGRINPAYLVFLKKSFAIKAETAKRKEFVKICAPKNKYGSSINFVKNERNFKKYVLGPKPELAFT